MAICRFSKMAAAAILDFQNFKFLTVGDGSRGLNCFAVPNLVEIDRTVAERYADFSIFLRWRPSAILDLLCEWLDHPRRAFGGLYHCAKFGWNRCSSFDNMQVLVFRDLGLETPIHAPKIGFLGIWPHKWGAISLRLPKGTSLCRNTSYDVRIDRYKKAGIRWQDSAPPSSGYWPTSEPNAG